jgi:hypothetical protein
MKKTVLIILSIIFTYTLTFTIPSCQYKNQDELFCDTTRVTYSGTIIPILQTNCYRCHGTSSNSGSGGIILQDYSVLQTYAADGKFYGNVAHLPGYIPMPYDGGSLTHCEILKIKNWVDKGYPNN